MSMIDNGWPHKTSPFHKGERELQELAGVADDMDQFARRVIRPFMPDQHREFFEQLPVIYAGHVDAEGWPWATALAGYPGFANSPDPEHLHIHARPVGGDPLQNGLRAGAPIGLLGLEKHTRRRNRLNATIESVLEDGLSLKVDQSFGNCPQYIQTRNSRFVGEPENAVADAIVNFEAIDGKTAAFIEKADTFFVSSFVKNQDGEGVNGVDMSHRGGRPGFVKVEGNRLTIPDYTGNFHFNTLGNFRLNPKAGLLFVDFECGHMLQLTGRVDIIWEGPEIDHFEGAERAWTFTLEKGVWLQGALPLRFDFDEMSYNSLITGTWQESDARKQAESLKDEWRPFEITEIKNESSVIRSFCLMPADDKGIAPFDPGQFLSLQVNVEGEAKQLVRTYTVSSSPLDSGYRISVKRDGKVSSYLHDHFQVGNVVKVRAPRGKFNRKARDFRPAVLLAAGVGITPMISMMRHALQEGVRYRHLAPLTLIHTARNKAERAFAGEASQLAAQSGQAFQYVSLLTQPEKDADVGVDYHVGGYMTADLLQEVMPGGPVEFYICGPAGFMQNTYDLLRQIGVVDSNIYAEAFGPSSLKRDTDFLPALFERAADTATVRFTKSDLEFLWRREDGTLLEFAEAHGLTPEYSCRSGNCGSCAVRLRSGDTVHEDSPTALHAEDEILLCCSKPAKGTGIVEIEI